jgi:predicted permease
MIFKQWWIDIRTRLVALFRRTEIYDRADEELQFHLAMLEQRMIESGTSPADARALARRQLGNTTLIREQTLDAWRYTFVDTLIRDVRYAVRGLLLSKGWTLVVLLSLALGIGANTALFSGVNGLLLRTVPVENPETLVRLRSTLPNDMRRNSQGYGFSGRNATGQDLRETTSYPIYQTLRSANQTLTDIAASAEAGNLNVIVDGKAELASGYFVSGNYFELLGISPAIGRLLSPEDDTPSAAHVAMISHGFWMRRFGGRPDIVGTTLSANRRPVTIIGVTPQQFTSIASLTDNGPDLWFPLALDPVLAPSPASSIRLKDATYWWVQMVGRLKPGINFEQVRANLEVPFQNAARGSLSSYLAGLSPEQRALSENQNRNAVPRLEVDSAARGIYEVIPETVRSATILSVVVGLMLVIVCANVANLLLSRSAARQKEISVRLSMGATRWQLVRQLLTESLLLAFTGGASGILVAYWSRQLLPFAQTAPLDWRVLTFTFLLCLITGVAFGLVPAFRATCVDVSGSVKETSRSVTRSRTLLSKSLLVAQVAISVMVLIGAGLFLRTLYNLRNVDIGFNPRNVAIFVINPRLNGYDGARVANLYDQITERLSAVPGIKSASHSVATLLSGNVNDASMYIQGGPLNPASKQGDFTLWRMTVSPTFFKTLEIPLIRGRYLESRDTFPSSPHVAVINETAARLFKGEDPIGKRFGFSAEKTDEVEIVGIVRDAKYESVRGAATPTAFQPFPRDLAFTTTFEVRYTGAPAAATQAIRDTVRQIDANLPIVRMVMQTDLVEGRFRDERFFARSHTLFGGIALLVASLGLYGLMSYNVARRTNEIGIRMALGAERKTVAGMVLRESAILVLIGIGIGLTAALAAGRLELVTTMLFGVAPTDILTIAVATGTMLLVSMTAAYLPARRAARVDPVTALRHE